ncbi:unnamed protein product [Rhizophagus irregularis]|nr:unnamed protein product [Rhizophagus irregularis]
MATISPQVLVLFENLNKRQLELENKVTQLKNVIILLTQQELAAEIRNGVKELEKWIEEIAEEQETDKEKQVIMQKLHRNEEQFKQLQVSIRRAILTSKQNI